MTAEAKKILEDALSLPDEEREVLVEALSDSLRLPDAQLGPEWTKEIQSRIAEVERGDVNPIAWEDAKKELNGLLGRK